MRASKLLNVTLIFAGAVLSQSVLATVRTLSPPVTESGNISSSFLETYQSSLAKVNKMLSYINLAYIEIDMGKYGRAVSDARSAQVAASQLETNSPTFVTESKLKYGKLTYDIKGQEVNYYVPDSAGAFVIHDYDGFLTNTSSDNVIERDARMVNASLDVDLRQANKALSFAVNDLQNERYNSARVELAELHQGALTGETDIENPVWSIHDDLRLTQALLDMKQYSSAQFSLEHAREQLDIYKNIASEPDNADIIRKLDNEIVAMEMRLQGKSPVSAQKAEREINMWIHTVDGWMHTTSTGKIS